MGQFWVKITPRSGSTLDERQHYSLLRVKQLSGEVSGRIRREIELAPYEETILADRNTFRAILVDLESRYALQPANLLSRNPGWAYQHSAGCLGTLVRLLEDARCLAAEVGRSLVQSTDLQAAAMDGAALRKIQEEIAERDMYRQKASEGVVNRKMDDTPKPMGEGGKKKPFRRNSSRDPVGLDS